MHPVKRSLHFEWTCIYVNPVDVGQRKEICSELWISEMVEGFSSFEEIGFNWRGCQILYAKYNRTGCSNFNSSKYSKKRWVRAKETIDISARCLVTFG